MSLNNRTSYLRRKSRRVYYESDDYMEAIKYGNLSTAGRKMLTEYCERSTIHGVQYLGERNRSWMERIFWIIIFLISISVFCGLINNIWKKWSQIPVIVTFSHESTLVGTIPMPMITLCPNIKSNTEIFQFSKYENNVRSDESIHRNWTSAEKLYMDINFQLCQYKNADKFNFTECLFHKNITKYIQNIAPSTNDIFVRTVFGAKLENYTEYFDETLTEVGLCHTFNLLPVDQIYRNNVMIDDSFFKYNGMKRLTNWTVENGYENHGKNNEFPYRVYSSSRHHGLLVLLYGLIKDIDHVCTHGNDGFKFAIGTPGDIPRISNQFMTLPLNHEMLVEITPEVITSAKSTAYYPPSIRRCFYNSERYLQFFQIYSQSNCELECLTNFTLRKCNCVRFNMPRTNLTPVCGARNINCYLDAKRELMENNFRVLLDDDYKNMENVDCNCLPTCHSLTYHVAIGGAPLHNAVEDDNTKMSRILFYYKDNRFWSYERKKLYGLNEFTANAGGLLGLFMGISILSFVELFYFVTIRVLGNVFIRSIVRRISISRSLSYVRRLSCAGVNEIAMRFRDSADNTEKNQ